MKKINLKIIAPLFLLLIPLVGILFSDQVKWSLFDFAVMGSLLLLLGTGIDLICKKITKQSSRLIYISILILSFLVIWIEIATGVFNSPIAGS